MYQPTQPISLKKNLPTMYDLPSENQEEPGLPDEFHLLQPELLRLTFRPPNYPEDQVFTASDLNLYYDPNHYQWYKRSDWFAVLGVSRLYQQTELRLSYVTWQERINPFVVVELISPGTEQEDLGKNLREIKQPPNKWQVYEQILKIPYYLVYNRYTDEFQAFCLNQDRYQPLTIEQGKVWLEEAELGIGLWWGEYQGIQRNWLRCYDCKQNWIPTPEEQQKQCAELEKQRAELEKQRAESEKQRAEAEKQRAESEKQRADDAESELARLKAFLQQSGIQYPQ